jgi:hypothetical protein
MFAIRHVIFYLFAITFLAHLAKGHVSFCHHILIFSSKTTGLIATKLWWNGPWMARLGLIWFSGFRGEDSNVIFYQNLPNLHNRYKSAERKISQKNPE